MSADRDAVTAMVDATTQAGISRRRLLAAAAAGTAAAVVSPAAAQAAKPGRTRRPKGRHYRELDARIERAMRELGIPGAAVGLTHGARQYVRGYGVTNTEYPQPVDADTLFRIGSTTKTFTTGKPDGGRSNFVRGADGSIAWLRTHGRLLRPQR